MSKEVKILNASYSVDLSHFTVTRAELEESAYRVRGLFDRIKCERCAWERVMAREQEREPRLCLFHDVEGAYLDRG